MAIWYFSRISNCMLLYFYGFSSNHRKQAIYIDKKIPCWFYPNTYVDKDYWIVDPGGCWNKGYLPEIHYRQKPLDISWSDNLIFRFLRWISWTKRHHEVWVLEEYSQWASCQIRKIAGAHAPGMPGTFSPSPQVSDPDMHVRDARAVMHAGIAN